MDLELAQILKRAADIYGIYAKVYEDYSGRAMYGDTTAGLVLENPNHLAVLVAQACIEGEDIDPSDLEYIRIDQLGRKYIVY